MATALTGTLSGLAPGAGVDDLDAAATLAAAEVSVRARRQAEVHDLLLVARWADLHSDLPVEDPDVPRHAREKMIQPGGDGTPGMREFALPELAWAKQVHHATVRAQLADILDLRLPQRDRPRHRRRRRVDRRHHRPGRRHPGHHPWARPQPR